MAERDRVLVVEATEDVRASPDDVLEFVMDVDRYRQADHKITRVRHQQRRGNEVVVSMWTRAGPLRVPATQQLRLTPGRRIDVTNVPSWQDRIMTFHGEFTCVPAEGAVRVTHRYTFAFTPLAAPVAPFIRRWLQDDIRREVQRVRLILEGHSPEAIATPGSVRSGAATVQRLLPFQNRSVNPLVVALGERGLLPATYALLETVGRRSGRIRKVPVANGLQGDTFWLIAGLGEKASFVRNIRANPRVRIKARPARLRDGVRMVWRSGTAHPLPADDPRERHRALGRGRPAYRLDGIFLRALDRGDMLTVRIDLD